MPPDRFVGQPITKILSRVEVDETTGCWLFTGAHTREGHGQVSIGGTVQYAHRAMWTAVYGPLATGIELHHKCRHPACVNTKHLQPVTRREHTALSPASIAYEHKHKTHCPKGHPLVAGNLVLSLLAHGRRQCLICRRASGRASHLRHGAARNARLREARRRRRP